MRFQRLHLPDLSRPLCFFFEPRVRNLHLHRTRRRRLPKRIRLLRTQCGNLFRSTTPSRWRSSTTTPCSLRAPRSSRTRRRRSPRISAPIRCFWGTRSSFPSSTQASSTRITSTTRHSSILASAICLSAARKRQHRLQAAKDQTAVTRAQVADNERSLAFSVATQFINVELAESTLELAQQDLKSFQNTVDIGEARYKAGDIGEGDLLKIKLQMLQFQTDVSAAQLARVQALSDLRQLLGYESDRRGLRRGRLIRIPAASTATWKIFKRRHCRTGPTCGQRSWASPPPTANMNCRRRSASATSRVRSATPTSATATTSRSSARCRCRSSIATRVRLPAPASPSRRRRSRRNSRPARC